MDGYFSLAVIALTLPDHPHSNRWLAEAKRQIAEDLDQGIYIYESGAGNECEIYRAMSVNFLTQLAMLFKTHGMPELAEHPRLKQALKWFIEFSVPPVPKVSYGLPRALPFDGDTTTTTPPVYGMFGMGAALTGNQILSFQDSSTGSGSSRSRPPFAATALTIWES